MVNAKEFNKLVEYCKEKNDTPLVNSEVIECIRKDCIEKYDEKECEESIEDLLTPDVFLFDEMEPLKIDNEIYYSVKEIGKMRKQGLLWRQIAKIHNVGESEITNWYSRNKNDPNYISKIKHKGSVYGNIRGTDILLSRINKDLKEAINNMKLTASEHLTKMRNISEKLERLEKRLIEENIKDIK